LGFTVNLLLRPLLIGSESGLKFSYLYTVSKDRVVDETDSVILAYQ